MVMGRVGKLPPERVRVAFISPTDRAKAKAAAEKRDDSNIGNSISVKALAGFAPRDIAALRYDPSIFARAVTMLRKTKGKAITLWAPAMKRGAAVSMGYATEMARYPLPRMTVEILMGRLAISSNSFARFPPERTVARAKRVAVGIVISRVSPESKREPAIDLAAVIEKASGPETEKIPANQRSEKRGAARGPSTSRNPLAIIPRSGPITRITIASP
jgi:hypothetical protein